MSTRSNRWSRIEINNLDNFNLAGRTHQKGLKFICLLHNRLFLKLRCFRILIWRKNMQKSLSCGTLSSIILNLLSGFSSNKCPLSTFYHLCSAASLSLISSMPRLAAGSIMLPWSNLRKRPWQWPDSRNKCLPSFRFFGTNRASRSLTFWWRRATLVSWCTASWTQARCCRPSTRVLKSVR